MTNKELIKYEVERLEVIRQYLITTWGSRWGKKMCDSIRELGDIEYELETKIKC